MRPSSAQLSRRQLVRWGAWSGLGLATIGLAACGQPAPAAPTSAPTTSAAPAPTAAAGAATAAGAAPAAKAAEISFWPRSPTEQSVVWEKLLPIAKQRYPTLTVKLEAPAEDAAGKLLVAFAGGTAPDGAVGGLSAMRSYIGLKMLRSIQEYIDADKEVTALLPEYVPAAIKGYSYQAKLYAVPTVNESILVFYHKDAIDQAGLTPPRDIQDDAQKWNWNTLVDYAMKLNKGTGFRRERFGIVATAAKAPTGMSESWGNLAYARGARFLDEAGEKWLFNSPEARESVQYIVDLIYKHDVHPDVGDSASANVRDRVFFQNGQMALVVQGEYFRRYLWGSGKPSGGIKFNYDMAKMPFNPTTGKRTNVYHGNGSFMTTQSKNADAAWQWLKIIFLQEAQQIITNTWGSRGAHRGTYGPWLESNADGGPPGLNYRAIVEADADTEPFPTTPYLTVQSLLEPTTRILYDNVFLNKTPVAEGLAQIEKETTALLEKGKQETAGRK
jgi:multiple sugar transport system substrate-binding protein